MLEKLTEHIKKVKNDKRAVTGTVWGLIGVAIAMAALIIIFQIVPMIGYQVDTAVEIPNSSQWSADNPDSNIVSGVSLWEAVGPLIKLVAIVSLLGLVIASVMLLGGREEKKGGGI